MDPRMRQRVVQVRQARGRRRTRVTALIAAVLTVVVAVFGLLHTGLFGVRHVRIIGPHPGMDAADLLAAAGISRDEALLDVDRSTAAGHLDRLAWMADARVSRVWPDSVDITVSRRRAVAIVPTGSALTGPADLVDATGRVLERVEGRRPHLPVVVGVGLPGAPGSWLEGSVGAGSRAGAVSGSPQSVARTLATATDGVQAALGIAAGIGAFGHGRALGPGAARVTTLDVSADGTVSAVVDPGSVIVTLGTATELAAKVTALVSMLDTQHLATGATLDLQVPDRPTVTLPASS